MSWLEWITGGEKLIGLILAIVGLLAGFGRWFWNRVKSQVNAGVVGLEVGHTNIAKRLSDLEEDVSGINNKIGAIGGRVKSVETAIGQLAKKEDLANLSVELARVSASGIATSSQVDSMYRALIDNADRKS